MENLVKMTNYTCACNGLTDFECEAQATGNGSYEKFQNLHGKSREITLGEVMFWRVFDIRNHSAAPPLPQS